MGPGVNVVLLGICLLFDDVFVASLDVVEV